MSGKRERKSEFWPDFATFCREGEIWITRQIVFDASLPPHCTRVAACIRMSVKFEDGLSKVGVVTIAVALGLSDDTVSRCIAAMEQAGHMSVIWGRGRGKSHLIRWIIKPGTRTDAYSGVIYENIVGLDEEKTARLRDFLDAKNTALVRGFGRKNPATLPEKPRKEGDKTPHGCGPNYIENYKENYMGDSPLTPQAEKDAVCEGEKITPAAESIAEADAVALPAATRKRSGVGAHQNEAEHLSLDATDANRMFTAIFDRWLKRMNEKDEKVARRTFMQALAAGADPEAIARGAAAYLADRRRDKRGAAAVIHFTTPLARWLDDRGWETWASLPDAEQQAAASEVAEREAMKARMREREDRRRGMLF